MGGHLTFRGRNVIPNRELESFGYIYFVVNDKYLYLAYCNINYVKF